ncbi:MAG: precorrin-2 C(20)-methyltransferase [Ruminococcus sp.]|nr:precorrin-2 C(20)-methyltransferase [Ruminococcus sp.]
MSNNVDTTKKGTVYCVGVGPGDPELMTLKAARLIRENDLIAVPGRAPYESAAYKTAAAAVPEIAEKELVAVHMPMVRDREKLRQAHRSAAQMIESFLDKGRDVVYLTLGDSTIYCTFSYIRHILEEDGYNVQLVSGIPSFCAAAARLGVSLAERDEELHVIPGAYINDSTLSHDGTYVIMKSASRMKEVREVLRQSGMQVQAVENCGMESEKLYRSIDSIPDDAGYFSLIIAKGENK